MSVDHADWDKHLRILGAVGDRIEKTGPAVAKGVAAVKDAVSGVSTSIMFASACLAFSISSVNCEVQVTHKAINRAADEIAALRADLKRIHARRADIAVIASDRR